jgi:hypothetical protein
MSLLACGTTIVYEFAGQPATEFVMLNETNISPLMGDESNKTKETTRNSLVAGSRFIGT